MQFKISHCSSKIFAILYTPLHVRSFYQYLKSTPKRSSVYIKYIDLNLKDKRALYYVNLLNENKSRHDFIKEDFCSSLSIFDIHACFWSYVNKATLFTGNPRRTLSIWYSRFCKDIIILEEGIGTTYHGGYFDPKVKENSVTKKIAISLGVIKDYTSVTKKIKYHLTSYSNSIFTPYFIINFRINLHDEIISSFPEKVNIIVSSWMNIVGPDRYIKVINDLFDNGVERDSIFLCAHPKDNAKYILNVYKTTGIVAISTPLILEDLCLSLLDSGRSVYIHGDRNSSALMLKKIIGENVRYEDFTKELQ